MMFDRFGLTIEGNRATRYALTVLILYSAIALSLAAFGWMRTWSGLNVPAMYPPFADLRTIQGALISQASGFDPQINNPGDPWGRPMNYPMIWSVIAKLLNLGNDTNYLIFVTCWIVTFAACVCSIIYRFPSLWILAAIFSGSNLLLLERGNNDLIVFCLVYVSIIISWPWSASLFVIFAAILKIYPLFSVFHMHKNWKTIVVILIVSAIFIWLDASEIAKIRASTPTCANLCYGVNSLSLVIKKRLDIDISYPALLIFHVGIALYFVLRNTLIEKWRARATNTHASQMFIAGGGVYVLTFLLSANWDYRLVFLIFCIPYILLLNDYYIKYTILISIIMASNYRNISQLLGLTGAWLNTASKSFLFVSISIIMYHELSLLLPIRNIWPKFYSAHKTKPNSR